MRDDLIKRLAAANPVPNGPESRPDRTRARRFRMEALAWGLATIVAVTGAVFFAPSGSHAHSGGLGLLGPQAPSPPMGPTGPPALGGGDGPTAPTGPTGAAVGPTGGFYGPTGWTGPANAGRVWTGIALADAPAALGAPIVLPTAPPLPPANETGAMVTAQCPHRGETHTSKCNVAVHFPSLHVVALYTRITYADPLSVYQAEADANERGEVARIGGVPALVITNPLDHAHPNDNWSYVEFVAGGTTVALSGSDAATLEKLARSIIDQANSG